MEEQQRIEIGDRIRDLRNKSQERLGRRETNRSIAEYVGVSERAVSAWMQKKPAKRGKRGGTAPTYQHAKKIAKLFEVSIDWLWRGKEKGDVPDVIGALNGPNPANAESGEIAAVRGDLAELRTLIEANQTKLLAKLTDLQTAQASERKQPKRRKRNQGDSGN